jgi:hypothetical protein
MRFSPTSALLLVSCVLSLADACRPSSGAAVGFLFSNLGGNNWKSGAGWSTPLTKAAVKSEFFGLKQQMCGTCTPCSCARVTRM